MSFSRGIFFFLFCATKSVQPFKNYAHSKVKKEKRLEAITPKYLQKLYKLLNWIMAVVIEPKGAYIHYLLTCVQLIYVIVSKNDINS